MTTINNDKCMSRKNKTNGFNIQCPNPRKLGEYCMKHHNCKGLVRIDIPLPSDKKISTKQYNGSVIPLTPNKNKKNIKIKIKNKIINNDKIKEFNNLIDGETIYALKIKTSKNYDIKRMIEISGPAYVNPCLSHDDIDPISQDQIWTIENGIKIKSDEILNELLFSYVDKNGFVRCFNIESLLYLKDYVHPITNDKMDNNIVDMINEKINMLYDTVKKVIKIDKAVIIEYTFNVFSKFSKNNIYIKDEWFLNLDIKMLQKMYYEIRDFYFNNLNINKKLFTFPPTDFNNTDILNAQYYLLHNIDLLTNTNEINKNKNETMIIYIVIGSLSTVCKEVRVAYPDISFGFTI
jgi:hypothetical protein